MRRTTVLPRPSPRCWSSRPRPPRGRRRRGCRRRRAAPRCSRCRPYLEGGARSVELRGPGGLRQALQRPARQRRPADLEHRVDEHGRGRGQHVLLGVSAASTGRRIPARWSSPRKLRKAWTQAPALTAPSQETTLEYPADPMTLKWKPVPGAVRYRVSVATDATFSSSVLGARYLDTVTNAFTVPNALAPGRYYWAVAPISTAVAHVGLVGQGLVPADLVAQCRHRPRSRRPGDRPERFSWNAVPGAGSYEIEINYSHDWAAGSKVCCDRAADATSVSPTTLLGNNTYFWRAGRWTRRATPAPAGRRDPRRARCSTPTRPRSPVCGSATTSPTRRPTARRPTASRTRQTPIRPGTPSRAPRPTRCRCSSSSPAAGATRPGRSTRSTRPRTRPGRRWTRRPAASQAARRGRPRTRIRSSSTPARGTACACSRSPARIVVAPTSRASGRRSARACGRRSATRRMPG